jgi:DNA topoisomerase IB
MIVVGAARIERNSKSHPKTTAKKPKVDLGMHYCVFGGKTQKLG